MAIVFNFRNPFTGYYDIPSYDWLADFRYSDYPKLLNAVMCCAVLPHGIGRTRVPPQKREKDTLDKTGDLDQGVRRDKIKKE